MYIFDRVLNDIKRNKSLREQGKQIIIPSPFKRLGTEWAGIEKGKYFLLSGNQKSAKTQVTDHIFLYNPIDFVKNNNTNIKIKIFDFNLEMSSEEKLRQAIVRRLYEKHRKRLTTRQLKSVFENSILPDNILRFIEEDREYFEFFENHVEFIDNTKNPFGIYKIIRDYMHSVGKFINKKGEVIPIELIKKNDEEINKSISHYEYNDDDLFVIVIIDNINLLKEEKIEGKVQTLFEAIGKLSSDYCVTLRNKFKVTFAMIQQQSLVRESNESMKMNTTEPNANGLADNKVPSKDANCFMTIYSPFRNKIKSYMDYDITLFRDNFRRFSIEFDREGPACETALFFDGAINLFKELPKPSEYKDLEKYSNYLKDIREKNK